jgi:hypothetical protein
MALLPGTAWAVLATPNVSAPGLERLCTVPCSAYASGTGAPPAPPTSSSVCSRAAGRMLPPGCSLSLAAAGVDQEAALARLE